MTVQKTDEGYRFSHVLLAAADALRDMAFAEVIANGSDLTLRQCTAVKKICTTVDLHPEGLTLKELAAELELTPGTVSELVETLVGRGIFQRRPHSGDRRKVLITLMPEYMEKLKKGIKLMAEISQRVLNKADSAGRETMIALLEDIDQHFKKMQIKEEKA